jgi:hypothetical protein
MGWPDARPAEYAGPTMRTATAWLLGLSLGLVAAVGPRGARADVVELTTGERIVGTVLPPAPDGLPIELPDGRVLRVDPSRVAAIRFEPAGPPATHGPPPSPRGGPAAAPAPGPILGPPPRSAAAEREQAFFAFRRLHAATARSVAREDYEALVAEARERVDRYLTAPADEDLDVRQAFDTALRYHIFAAEAWARYDARADLRPLGSDPVVRQCRELRELIARLAARWRLSPNDPALAGLVAGSDGLPALWACAADAIARAEADAGNAGPPGAEPR